MSDKPKLIERLKQSGLATFMREKVKPIAGDVLEIVGDITGVDAVERVGELLNKRKENDENVRALAAEFEEKRLEWAMEIERTRMEVGLEEMRLEVQDKQGARHTEIQRLQATGGKRDWLMMAVGACIIACFLFYAYCSVFYVIHPENREFFIEMRATARDAMMMLIGYYFGSSLSSRKKDATIDRITK